MPAGAWTRGGGNVTAVRWGVIGTAGIARKNFLPAVREAGGQAAAVAGRDADRTSTWARDNAVDRAVVGYQPLIDDPGVDALYIPLPNALHAQWTIRALRAGKPVLCEKPLTGSLAETEQVLAVARETGTPLWEAFVFPFHDQMRRLRELIADGVIGELREIQSNFHFLMTRRDTNIRMSAELAGGALLDVGCYPVRLARDLFAAEHTSAWATAGQINITNPFHPTPQDRFEVHVEGSEPTVHPGAGPNRESFTPAVRHIQAVVKGEEKPRLLAIDTSLGSARALDDLARSAAAQAGAPAP